MHIPPALPARGYVPAATWMTQTPRDLDILLVPVLARQDGEIAVDCTGEINPAAKATLTRMLTAVGADGSTNEVHVIPAPEGVPAQAVAAVGVGEGESVTHIDAETVRRAVGVAARAIPAEKTVFTFLGEAHMQASVEGFLLGSYDYRGLRTEERCERAASLTVVGGDRASFDTAVTVAQAVAFARDLVNTPCSHLYPASYAQILENEAPNAGVDVEVLDEKQLHEQGYGGILAVGQGSSRPPRLVRLSWSPESATTRVGLVGKGITFDTGGISLKPGAKMDDMISDMGGSAAMAATVLAAAQLHLPVHVTATLPLAENMPGGHAYRPGDVVTHYGGATTEVLNTDAEGRLVLADALVRACEDKPDYLIDTATLTGAQLVALGVCTSGVMGDETLRERLAAIGRSVGEPAWAMPIPEEIAAEFRSSSADRRNIGTTRFAGMMQAGYFLSEFVGDTPWAHMDIAGPAYNTTRVHGYTPMKGTGVPVRTLIAFLADVARNG